MFMQWYALAFAKLWEGYSEPRASEECPEALKVIKRLIFSSFPEVRAAAVYACGTFFNAGRAPGTTAAASERVKELEINIITSFQVDDPSPAVRIETVHALSRFAECYIGALSAYVQQASGPPRVPGSSPQQQQQQQSQQQQHSPVAQTLVLPQPPTFLAHSLQTAHRPPSAYFRRDQPLQTSRKHASVYMEQSPAGSSAPFSGSSSSSSSSSSSAAAMAMLCPAQDASFYQFLWNALVGLARDPQPEVAALAGNVVRTVRNYGDVHARYARSEEFVGIGGLAASLPTRRSGSQNRAPVTKQQFIQDMQGSSISVSSSLYERCCEYWNTPIADKAVEDHSSPEYKARERRYRNSVCVYNSAREAWRAWNTAEKKDLSSQLPSLESKFGVVTSAIFYPFESILVCATDNQIIK